MLLTLHTCLLWLMTSGLWTIRAQHTEEDKSTGTPNENPYQKLAPNNIDFAFNLFEHLQTEAPNENIIFSPISISMALSMMALSADNETSSKILEGLGLNRSPIPEVEIHQNFQKIYHVLKESDYSLEESMGNILFSEQNQKLKDLNSDDLKRYYRLENVAIDPNNWSSQINEYLKNKTWGEISNLFLEPKQPGSLVLVNYISFTGLWALPFDSDHTTEGNFFGNDFDAVRVTLMHERNNFKFLYDELLGCLVVQLDYVDDSAFYFILPDVKELNHVIRALSQDCLQRWSVSMVTRPLDLYIPKFSLTGTYDLGDIMKAMGIIDLKGEQTDLSGITGSAQRKLSKVLHKAKLDVTEEGLYTEENLYEDNPTDGTKPRASRTTSVRVDRPFLFLILDHVSNSILYLGKVVNPSET